MAKRIAIIGAGLIGRILAIECQLAGMAVSLFDRDKKDGQLSCAYAGAGMLAPYTELESTEPIIADLGIESLHLWPALLKKLPRHVFFQQNGSLVLAHPQDHADLARFQRAVQFKLESFPYQDSNRVDELHHPDRADELHHSDRRGAACAPVTLAGGCNPPLQFQRSDIGPIQRSGVGPTGHNAILKVCDREQISDLEPELPATFTQGIYLSDEGQIDNRQLLIALEEALDQFAVDWQTGVDVISIAPYKIEYINNDGEPTERGFDLIIDCRGLGGKPDIKQLRGVRGELLVVEAPAVRSIDQLD